MSVFTVAPAEASDQIGIKLQCDSVVVGGARFAVNVSIVDSGLSLGGFNFLIAYDRAMLIFDSASLGSLTRGEWEYFTFREDLLDRDDPSSSIAVVRLVALADQADSKNRTPSAKSQKGPGDLATLHFMSNPHAKTEDSVTQLRFAWNKCDDNTLSDPTGNSLYAAREVLGADGRLAIIGYDRFSGPEARCFRKRLNAPQRVLLLQHARTKLAARLPD